MEYMFLHSVHKKILLAVILDYKLFQMCLFKALSLKQALWMQLIIVELSSKIFKEPEQTHIFHFVFWAVKLNCPQYLQVFLYFTRLAILTLMQNVNYILVSSMCFQYLLGIILHWSLRFFRSCIVVALKYVFQRSVYSSLWNFSFS